LHGPIFEILIQNSKIIVTPSYIGNTDIKNSFQKKIIAGGFTTVPCQGNKFANILVEVEIWRHHGCSVHYSLVFIFGTEANKNPLILKGNINLTGVKQCFVMF
jgi:hypothetical protein